jgi:hypothetical protein
VISLLDGGHLGGSTSDTGFAVFDGLVRKSEFSQIVTDHIGLHRKKRGEQKGEEGGKAEAEEADTRKVS